MPCPHCGTSRTKKVVTGWRVCSRCGLAIKTNDEELRKRRKSWSRLEKEQLPIKDIDNMSDEALEEFIHSEGVRFDDDEF